MSDSHNDFERALERYFTSEQLERIRAVKIGIAGAGGLGSNSAVCLVRSGFRRLRIADFDRVEWSNLNRQYYFTDQVGQLKVEALKDNLRRINPDLEIQTFDQRVTAANVNELFADCDVVVEAFDQRESKQLIVQTFFRTDKLLVAASGLAGWGDSDRLTVKKITPSFFLVGDQLSEVSPDRPPCAPRVNIAAAKEADIVLSWILRRRLQLQWVDDYVI